MKGVQDSVYDKKGKKKKKKIAARLKPIEVRALPSSVHAIVLPYNLEYLQKCKTVHAIVLPWFIYTSHPSPYDK